MCYLLIRVLSFLLLLVACLQLVAYPVGRVNLCVRKSVIYSSFQAQFACGFMGQKWRSYESYASLLIVERNTSVGSMPMCSASQTDFSTFSDPLLESANLRKFQHGACDDKLAKIRGAFARIVEQRHHHAERRCYQDDGNEERSSHLPCCKKGIADQ